MADPKYFWGPCEWKAMHCKAVAYVPTEENAVAFKIYIQTLTKLLPCDRCRQHLATNLRNFPIDDYLLSNEALFLWTYNLHDYVNRQLGKRSPPFNEIKRHYFENMGVRCDSCNA